MIKCEICEREFRVVSNHLKQHKLTVKKYKEKYPEAKLIVQEISEKMSKSRKMNFTNGDVIPWQLGKTKHTDERLKLSGMKQSQTKLIKYASGELKNWNNGLTGDLSCFSGSGNPMYQISIYDNWIKKYGKETADKKYENWKNNISKGNSLNGYIEKYGEEDGKKLWNDRYERSSRKQSGKNNHMFGKPCPERKLTLYKNIWFKSTWEAMFAYEMDLQGIKWEYEKYRIQIVDSKTYCPDFIIYNELGNIVEIVEVKGYKNGSEKYVEILQKCCRVSVKLCDESEMKRMNIFRHEIMLKKLENRKFMLEIS